MTLLSACRIASRSPIMNNTDGDQGAENGPHVHTIDNCNPYRGVLPMEPGQGRQSVIFEPLQNVQMSWSKFQVTSFIDFQTYLDYFANYETYLDKFQESVRGITSSPVYCQYMANIGGNLEGNLTMNCDARPQCKEPRQMFRIEYGLGGRGAHRIDSNNHIPCQNRHAQACLVQRQFSRLQNMTTFLQQNYFCVKQRFLSTIDFVKDTRADLHISPISKTRKRQTTQPGDPERRGPNQPVSKQKRLIDLLAGIGVIINSVQIKKIK